MDSPTLLVVLLPLPLAETFKLALAGNPGAGLGPLHGAVRDALQTGAHEETGRGSRGGHCSSVEGGECGVRGIEGNDGAVREGACRDELCTDTQVRARTVLRVQVLGVHVQAAHVRRVCVRPSVKRLQHASALRRGWLHARHGAQKAHRWVVPCAR